MLTFLAEFLFSAVLWGSLITWWLWRRRKRAQSGIARKLLWLPLFWFGLHTAFAWYGFVLPPAGRLVEDQSGQPIPNARVETNWGTFPVMALIGDCPGFQAHLSDAEGDFSFRFAPVPTLFLSPAWRTIMPQVPGRFLTGRAVFFPKWLRGEMRIRHYQAGHSAGRFMGGSCQRKFLPQNWGWRLRGEEEPFSAVYREACVEQQPWTLMDLFIRDLMRYAIVKGMHDPKRFVSRLPMPPALNAKFNAIRPGACGSEEGVCATAIDPALRAEICSYFTNLIRITQEER